VAVASTRVRGAERAYTAAHPEKHGVGYSRAIGESGDCVAKSILAKQRRVGKPGDVVESRGDSQPRGALG
jgi:hypothetical protein